MIKQTAHPQNSPLWRTAALVLVVLYLLGLVWAIWSWQSRAATIKTYERNLAALQAHGLSQPQARSLLRDQLFRPDDPLADQDLLGYFAPPQASLLAEQSAPDSALSLMRWETSLWPRELMAHYTNLLTRAGWRVVAWSPDGARFEYLRSQCDQSSGQCQAVPLYHADIKLSQDLSVVKTTIEIELRDLR